MKKNLLITLIASIILLFALLIAAIFVAFSEVTPLTQAINQDLASRFSKIVRIPKGIPPPAEGFDETIYFWEMETLEKEVTGVRFKHLTGFKKSQDTIIAILEMPEKGDPSIFNKVLAAVIADNQSLKSAKDVEKANFSANDQAGYDAFTLSLSPNTNQTTKITWEFKRSSFEEELTDKYQQLFKYPEPLLKILYNLPKITLSLLSG